ncbi:hypothetical protein EDB89DRAFT_1854866, partial [Lactarius sanguifluus]
TFLACLLTVSASNVLSCPEHPQRGRFADGDEEGRPQNRRVAVEAEKWIEEHHPSLHDT